MKPSNIFFVLFIAVVALISKPVVGQNIALTKSYTISPLPNLLIHPLIDKYLVLTDGKFATGGYFWSQPTSLSWVKVPQVICTIDLTKIDTISAVSISTCRRVDSDFDVRFPSHIFIFISNNNKYFEYAGDAALSPYNLPGPYELKKFTLGNIEKEARYVKLFIIPDGLTFSCDEIEVKKGTHIQHGSLTGCVIDSVNKYADSLISIYNMNMRLVKEGKRLMTKSNGKAKSLALDQFMNENNSPKILGDNSHLLKLQVQSLYLNDLRSKYKSSLLLYKISPWDTLSTISFPSSVAQQLDYSLIVPVGGHQFGSFVLINVSNKKKIIHFTMSGEGRASDSIKLFHAAYVQARYFRLIPDALVPLVADKFSIEPGRPELFFFKITGQAPGIGIHDLIIRSDNIVKEINIKVKTIKIDSFNDFKLNTNVWLNTYHEMIRDRQAEAIQDLKKHHINVLEIGIGYLPPLNKPDFKTLGVFLSSFSFAKTLLISTDFSSNSIRVPDTHAPFMSFIWKNEFIKWYGILLRQIKHSGFSMSQVYFYPYDEVRGLNITDFIKFASWIHDSVAEVKLYATISPMLFKKPNNLGKLISLLNVAQIGLASPICLPILPKHHGQIWIYENSPYSKEESPYSHYRLMAWGAYLHDVTGVGFWSYTGEPGRKFYTDPFRDSNLDYGVVYDGPGKSILSTRRWEAFSLGVEDYQILYLYGEKFGIAQAKFMAKSVLDHKLNCKVADSVRDYMIKNMDKE